MVTFGMCKAIPKFRIHNLQKQQMHVLLMRGKAKDDITYDYMIQSWVNIYLLLKGKKQYAHTQNIYIYIYIYICAKPAHTKPSRLVSKWKLNHMI